MLRVSHSGRVLLLGASLHNESFERLGREPGIRASMTIQLNSYAFHRHKLIVAQGVDTLRHQLQEMSISAQLQVIQSPIYTISVFSVI